MIAAAVAFEEPKQHLISSAWGKVTTSTESSPHPLKRNDKGVDSHAKDALELKGTGAQQTRQFSVDSDWDLVWTYDCSNIKAMQERIFITVYDSKGRVSADTPPVMKIGAKGEGVQHYHKAGSYFLGINAQCAWSVVTRPAK